MKHEPKTSHKETNLKENENPDDQLEELKKEIAQLKQNKNYELRKKKTKTNDQNDHSKNL